MCGIYYSITCMCKSHFHLVSFLFVPALYYTLKFKDIYLYYYYRQHICSILKGEGGTAQYAYHSGPFLILNQNCCIVLYIILYFYLRQVSIINLCMCVCVCVCVCMCVCVCVCVCVMGGRPRWQFQAVMEASDTSIII